MLAAGFGELATQLGAADGGDPVATVHAALAASPERWLLVFDNAPDRASVARFVPPAGPGRVLITSRDQIGHPGQDLDVPVLDQEVAADTWPAGPAMRTGGRPRTWPGSWAGCRWRWSRPPPTCRPPGIHWPATWPHLRQRRPEMLARGEPTGYSQTVATTWQLAFEHLQQADPGAAGLLRLLAYCAPEAIPLPLLLQPRPGWRRPRPRGRAGAGAASGGPAGGRTRSPRCGGIR